MAAEFESDPETFWQAFCYVAGELGGPESEAFERRLDHDQAAREAVAQAVELGGAMAALEGPSVSATGTPRLLARGRRPSRILAGGAALALAASLAFLLVNWGRGPSVRTSRPGAVKPATAGVSPRVALAWSSLHQERDTDRDDPGPLAANDDLSTPPQGDDPGDLAIPAWMLDAAALRASRAAPHPAASSKEL